MTDRDRIILFCDFERPLRNRVARGINHFISTHFVKATATQNLDTDKVGVANKLFQYIYQVRLLDKRLKQTNETAYYAIKYVLFGPLIYLIFF